MRRPRLELVVTASCSRCEDALDALLGMPELRGLALHTREVLASDDLYQRFAERVPVLLIDGQEIDWPFDAVRLRSLTSR